MGNTPPDRPGSSGARAPFLSNLETRLSTAWAWLTVPWREGPLAAALVAAAAAPAFLIAMSGLWQAAAGNEIAVRQADAGPPTDQTITVETPAFFDSGILSQADGVVRANLDRIEGYGPPIRTLLSVPGDRGAMLLVTDAADPRPLNVGFRLVHHPAALESVTVVDQLGDQADERADERADDQLDGQLGDQAAPPDRSGEPGVWISRWLADEEGIGLGDRLVSGECSDPADAGRCQAVLPLRPVTVVGVYEPLWDEEFSTDGYDVIPGLDPAILPRYISPFGLPNYALLLATDGLLDDLAIPGEARWSIQMEHPITGTADLTSRVASFRTLQTDLLTNRSLSEPLAALATDQGRATATTTLPSTLATTRRVLATLDQPFGSATTAGIALGLAAMAAAAAFSVSRRSKEFRLLAGEGDRWPDFAKRAAGQLVLPTAVGSTIGVVAARLIGTIGAGGHGSAARVAAVAAATNNSAADNSIPPPSIPPPSMPSPSLAAVDLTLVVVVAIVGVGIGAAVTGLLGQRALGDRPPLATPETTAAFLVVLFAMAGLLWVLVAREQPRPSAEPPPVDIAVIALPVSVLLAAIALSIVVLGLAARRLARLTSRLSPLLLLTWRRVSNRDGGGQLVMGALALALGLGMFTTSLATSLEQAADLKLATEVGAETRVQLVGRYPDDLVLPPGTTMVGIERSRAQPGDQPVQIVAIDPATFAEAVAWPTDDPLTVHEALALLASDVGDAVPVIALDGQPLAEQGAFGLLDPVRYQVVATVPSIPLASPTRSSLLVASDRIDEFVAARDALVGDVGAPPSSRYGRRLLSVQSKDDLRSFLDEAGVQQVEIATATERRAEAAFVAPRYTFGYLRWFAVVAVIGALIALGFFLSSRRARRALSTIMLRRMGLSATKSAFITALEVVVVTTAGAATALAVSPAITERLLPRFDPAPNVPPAVEAAFPFEAAITLLAVGLFALAALVWLVERRAMTRPEGPLLRAIE